MKIDDLIGKQYAIRGRGPEAYDCFGLFAELCRRRGLVLPPEPQLSDDRDIADAIAATSAREWIRLEAPEPGCAVLFRIVGPFVMHIGMVLDCGARFIHIRKGANVAIERLDSVVWRSRIAGYYSHV